MDYTVKLINFVGPLDLLLQLIERRDLEITDITISNITTDYIGHINSLDVPIDQMTWFSKLATQLLFIKSRTLTGTDDHDNETTEQIEQLSTQLITYKKFKQASQDLLNRFGQSQYPRLTTSSQMQPNVKYKNLTHQNLIDSYTDLIQHTTAKKNFSHQVLPKIAVEKYCVQLHHSLDRSRQIDSILDPKQTTVEKIGFFLALLELIKRQSVELVETSSGLAVRRLT